MSEPEKHYEIAELGSNRLLRENRVKIELPAGVEIVPLDHFQILLQFSTPATIAEVSDLVVDGAPEQVALLVSEFEKRGLLRRVSDSGSAALCESILNRLDERYRSEEALAAIGHHLSEGRCVVLDGGFEREFAERIYEALAEHTSWETCEENSPGFSFRNHKMSDLEPLPRTLRECSEILAAQRQQSR